MGKVKFRPGKKKKKTEQWISPEPHRAAGRHSVGLSLQVVMWSTDDIITLEIATLMKKEHLIAFLTSSWGSDSIQGNVKEISRSFSVIIILGEWQMAVWRSMTNGSSTFYISHIGSVYYTVLFYIHLNF